MSWVEQRGMVWDFIMLLRMAHHLKLRNCLFLEFSIFGLWVTEATKSGYCIMFGRCWLHLSKCLNRPTQRTNADQNLQTSFMTDNYLVRKGYDAAPAQSGWIMQLGGGCVTSFAVHQLPWCPWAHRAAPKGNVQVTRDRPFVHLLVSLHGGSSSLSFIQNLRWHLIVLKIWD